MRAPRPSPVLESTAERGADESRFTHTRARTHTHAHAPRDRARRSASRARLALTVPPPLRALARRACAVLFHPSKPHLFVATQRQVRLYDLVKQQLIKKLSVGVQWVSTMALHPGGDNLLVGSYDKRVAWFDLDLSTTPYKTLRCGRARDATSPAPRPRGVLG